MKFHPCQTQSYILVLLPSSAANRTGLLFLLAQVREWMDATVKENLDCLETWKTEFPHLYSCVEVLFSLSPVLGGQTTPLISYSNSELSKILDGIEKVNELDPSPKKNTDNIIIPSSGDWEADLIADLSKMYGIEGALHLYRTIDLQTIHHIVHRYNYLSIPYEKLKEKSDRARGVQKFAELAKSGVFDQLQNLESLDAETVF